MNLKYQVGDIIWNLSHNYPDYLLITSVTRAEFRTINYGATREPYRWNIYKPFDRYIRCPTFSMMFEAYIRRGQK